MSSLSGQRNVAAITTLKNERAELRMKSRERLVKISPLFLGNGAGVPGLALQAGSLIGSIPIFSTIFYSYLDYYVVPYLDYCVKCPDESLRDETNLFVGTVEG